ncbi:formyltetrahydrofolate deformylase [Viscerimonas tarda]
MNDSHAILLVHCPDQPGLVAAITDFVHVNGGNIVNLEQHVDRNANVFFMRIEWDLENFLIPKDKIGEYFQTMYANKYTMTFRLYFNDYRPRMAVFVSKMSHCLFDILARYTAGEWNVEIPVIISNHEDLRWVAEKFGIEYHILKINKDNKDEMEAQQMALLKEKKIDFIVLARYMQILTDNFITAYPNKIINIHHSFLPAFIGAKPYHAAYERGVKIIGATSHYVTTELDAGPIIEQDITRITHRDSVQDLVRKGQDLEKIVLSHAIDYHINRRALVYKNKTILFS